MVSVSPPRKSLELHSMPERIRRDPPASYEVGPPPASPPPDPECSSCSIGPPDPHHRQTIEIGAKLTSLRLFYGTRCCELFRIQLFLQFSYQFRQHFLRIPSEWASRASVSVHSSFQNCYACSRSISLSTVIAP